MYLSHESILFINWRIAILSTLVVEIKKTEVDIRNQEELDELVA